MLKIVTIVGARPQFIKVATVSRAISRHNDSTNLYPVKFGDHLTGASNPITEVLVHTGQHYDQNMSKIFFDELEIPQPDYNLKIGSDTHGRQTGKMLSAIEEVLEKEKPDWVLIYGDTNSTLAGALAASKLHIPVAHVEAGLRSFNRRMPEEINRVVADHLSTILFCPTETAVNNLRKEGFTNISNSSNTTNSINPIDPTNPNNPIVLNVGDVMYDSALFYSNKGKDSSSVLKNHGIKPKEYGLVTIHRAENTEDDLDLTRLAGILNGLDAVSKELLLIWPMHPRNKKFINQLDFNFNNDRFKVIDPVGYLHFVYLEKNAKMIFTDSGGVQKEAYFFQVPCITLRDETEWVETIESGLNILTGSNREKIINAYYNKVEQNCFTKKGLFGDGHASDKIVEVLTK